MLDDVSGIRFVLSDCGDASRRAAFDLWYDRYCADSLLPGLLRTAARFERAHSTADGPQFAAVYETSDPDPGEAWRQTAHHPARRFADDASDLLVTALRCTYALNERALASSAAEAMTGVSIVLGDANNPGGMRRRRAELLATGAFTTAASFTLVEGSPEPPYALHLFEVGIAGTEQAHHVLISAGFDGHSVATYRLLSYFEADGGRRGSR